MITSKKVNPISAISLGLVQGGCEYVSCYPGFHSHDIAKALGQDRICINEKTAYQMCYGANLSGKKAVLTIKGVGLNICADEYFHSLLSGVNGGMVIIITDDTEVIASQEWQDSRYYQSFYGGLWFEPCNLKEAYEVALRSFLWSQKMDIPIVIRLTSEYFRLAEEDLRYYHKKALKNKKYTIEKNSKKYIVYPNNWLSQQLNLNKKNNEINNFVEKYFLNKNRGFQLKGQSVVISAGVIKSIKPEILDGTISRLEISTYPIPSISILELIGSANEVITHENGRHYLRSQLKLIKDDSLLIDDEEVQHLNHSKPTFIIWRHLEKLFKAVKRGNFNYVVGDVGSYTVESTESINSCLCLGTAVGVATGMADSDTDYPLCITGDTGFAHGGILALYEALTLKVSLGIVIIDNGGSWSTGGQKIAFDIYSVSNDCQKVIYDYALVSQMDIYETLIKMKKRPGVSLLYIKVKQDKLSL